MTKLIDWTKPLDVVRKLDGGMGEVLGVYDSEAPGIVVGKVIVARLCGGNWVETFFCDLSGYGTSGWTIRNKPAEHTYAPNKTTAPCF